MNKIYINHYRFSGRALAPAGQVIKKLVRDCHERHGVLDVRARNVNVYMLCTMHMHAACHMYHT